MSDPTIICPNCKTEIKLTESLAAPLLEVSFRFLEWSGAYPGTCRNGLPWDCKSPEDQLNKLDKMHRLIVQQWSPQPNEANKGQMREAYSWLRATLERIGERVVFADVVFRFRSYVKLACY